jgi:hypothetical protein
VKPHAACDTVLSLFIGGLFIVLLVVSVAIMVVPEVISVKLDESCSFSLYSTFKCYAHG